MLKFEVVVFCTVTSSTWQWHCNYSSW